ncbi:MAG TPA: hypothetical protein PLO63_06255 [Syntrophales bacterium]|mgnify:CR=1 FL=1|nr:hypothetical protein [Syntrophales bacterium]
MGRRLSIWKRFLAIAAAAAVMALPGTLRADENYWYGTTGDGLWSTAGNWDLGSIPSEGQLVYVDSTSAVTYDATVDPKLNELHIYSTGAYSTVFNHSTGTLSLPGDTFLLVNGEVAGSQAVYNLSGDAVLIKDSYEVKIGTSGTGTFNQSGDSIFQMGSAMYLGDQIGTIGVYNMTGGTLTGFIGERPVDSELQYGTWYGDIALGEWGGKGYFNQSGGSVTVNTLTLARQIANGGIRSYGRYELSGGELKTSQTNIGMSGDGVFVQTGGTHSITGDLNLGSQSTGSGTYELSGGSLVVGGSERVGYSGSGSFTQTGSSTTHTVGANLVIANEAGSSGTFNLEGGTLRVGYFYNNSTSEDMYTDGSTFVGMGGTGTFTQSDGDHIISGGLTLGQESGSQGTYTLSGGTLAVSTHEHVGVSGKGVFEQQGGWHYVGGDLVLGNNDDGEGKFYMKGGTLDVTGTTTVGLNGTGEFNQTGGTFKSNAIINNGTFTYTGGIIQTSTFTNTGTFTGAGVINALSKGGSVAFTNSGILAPGNSPGTLSIGGNFEQTDSGTLAIELASLTSYDILSVTGTATLAGILQVILYEGYLPAVGDYYDFLTAGGLSGAFASILGPQGYSWTVDYLDLTNDGVIETARLTANAVPIPPAVWLLGTGLIGIVGIRRRWGKP